MPQMDSTQFSRAIEALSRDVLDAAIHWKLAKDLQLAINNWPLAFQQSPLFWNLTINAHIKVSILAACRAFDQNEKSLHLSGLLEMIQENLPLFEEEAFRDRLRGNPFVDALAAEPRRPDQAQLEQDIKLCSPDDSIVKTLIINRSNAIAHTNLEWALSDTNFLERFPIPTDEFEVLVQRGSDILNRYSHLFSASIYSDQIPGQDDHQIIFTSIQERVEANREAYS